MAEPPTGNLPIPIDTDDPLVDPEMASPEEAVEAMADMAAQEAEVSENADII